MLRVDVAKRLGAFQLEAAFYLAPRSTLVVVGESGSGKTTLLRLLAGLIEPDRGAITLGDTAWVDRARGIALPAQERDVGFVAQDYALFPHLTAVENVAFGPRRPRAGEIGRASCRERV